MSPRRLNIPQPQRIKTPAPTPESDGAVGLNEPQPFQFWELGLADETRELGPQGLSHPTDRSIRRGARGKRRACKHLGTEYPEPREERLNPWSKNLEPNENGGDSGAQGEPARAVTLAPVQGRSVTPATAPDAEAEARNGTATAGA